MKITYYKSNKLIATETVEVDEILLQTEPEYMTDEERERINKGKQTPMLTFRKGDGWISVPAEFVIKIVG
jgi:hypothetical protein